MRLLLLIALCALCAGPARAEEKMPVADLAGIKVLDKKTAQTVALAGNPNMAAAQARIEQARARVSQAAAAWWPSLDLVGAVRREQLSDTRYQYNQAIASLLGGSADRTGETTSGAIQATWVLFDGFYRHFKEQQASFEEQSTAAAMTDSQRLLVNAVGEAFLNTQLNQTNIDIAKADEAFYLRQLEDAQNRFKVGAGPWGDVLNIKVQLNSAKTGLMRYQREYEAAGYGLAALMGLPEARFPAGVRLEELDRHTAVAGQTETAEALIEQALATRPDILRLSMVIKQTEAMAGMAKAPNYPRVQVAGALEGGREDNVGLSGEDIGNSVGVNMSWNLYAGGADKARLLEAQQAKREAAMTLAGLRNGVAAEIRQDLALLAAALEQLELQRETVKLVEENRDLAKNEYEAGEASLVRLNEAQRDLTTTYGRLAQSLVAYHLANQRLMAATGRNLAEFEQAAGRQMMAAIGAVELVVPDTAIDANGHVNNVQYVQWMQDAAIAHSASLGWSQEQYAAIGRTWIIRSHTIEYLHSAYAGDRITVYTWVSEFHKFRSLRKFKFVRQADDTMLAVAATMFVLCDLATGKPRSIPPEVLAAYTLVGAGEEP